MAETISSIQSSGGDYTTFALWEADITADPAAGEHKTGRLDEAMNGGAVVMNVSNANGVTLKLTCAAAYRFYQQAGWPSCHAVEGLGGRMYVAAGHLITLSTPNVTIEWLELDAGSTAAGHNLIDCGVASTGHKLHHCVCHDFRLIDAVTNGYSLGLDISNCFFYACWSVAQTRYGSALTFKNVTISGCSGWGLYGYTGATLGVDNVICVDTVSGDFGGNAAGDYNVSEDATAPGANSSQGVAPTDILENVTAGSEDLHMCAAADGSYEGSDQSASIDAEDIDNVARGTWDIGADYYVGAGSSPSQALDISMVQFGPEVPDAVLTGLDVAGCKVDATGLDSETVRLSGHRGIWFETSFIFPAPATDDGKVEIWKSLDGTRWEKDATYDQTVTKDAGNGVYGTNFRILAEAAKFVKVKMKSAGATDTPRAKVVWYFFEGRTN